jgi:hypothetical protein
MKKLWVFGDSYAAPFDKSIHGPSTAHWAEILREKLECSYLELKAHCGAPNEWIYFQFKESLPLISPDDFVVVVTTQISRRWFFLNNVGSSNFNISSISTSKLSNEEKISLKYYATYLNNDHMSASIFDSVCNSIHYLSEKHNLNTILLPGFEEKGFPLSGKYTVSGSLFDVGINEIVGKSHKAWFDFIKNKNNGIDPRVGHLSEPNHYILSEKLYKTFINHTVLELNAGFVEEIV